MERQPITREKITKLHEITDRLKDLKWQASELKRTAEDRYKERTHTIERGGEQVEVREAALWTEVYHLGQDTQAGTLLKELHPEVFAAYADQEKVAEELIAFTATEFGIDFKHMTISDYVHLTEGLFSVLLAEQKQ